MLIHIIAILDLGNALIILGLKVRNTLLKICIDLIIDSMILKLTDMLVFSVI